MPLLDFAGSSDVSLRELDSRLKRIEAMLSQQSEDSGSGSVHIGFVVGYNPDALTIDIRSYDGELYKNVSLNPSVNDYELSARKYTVPALKSPCMYTVVSSQVIYLGSFFVPNAEGGLGEEPSLLDTLLPKGKDKNINDTTVSRIPHDAHEARDVIPGSSLDIGPSGSKIGFFDSTYFIKLSPIFYSLWSAINDTWETMCSIFRFRSPAVDVFVDVDKEQNTNVEINVRTKVSDRLKKIQPVKLKIGKDGGLIDMQIYGKPFIKVSPKREVILEVEQLKIKGKKVDLRGVDELIVNDPKNKKPGEGSKDEDKDEYKDTDKPEEEESVDIKPITDKTEEDVESEE